MMTTETKSLQPMEWADRYERLKEKQRQTRPDDDGDVDPSCDEPEYTFSRDKHGRDWAHPVKTVREIRQERWNRVCQDFDYTAGLLHESLLNKYQIKLRDQICLGRKNTILFGPPGSGKTTVAMLALHDLHMAGRRVKAARFQQFKTQMEPKYCDEHNVSPETVARWYREPEFLLLDELGYGDTRQTITEHERRIFFDLISVRDSTARRTWICSNVDRKAMHELYGEAAFSRLDGTGNCIVGDFTKEPNFRMRTT